jgi:hypothetical protein
MHEMSKLIADTVFIIFLWTMWGAYHSRIYMLAAELRVTTTRFPDLPHWNEQHIVHGISVIAIMLYLWLITGISSTAIGGGSLMGAGFIFNPLINVAYGRKWFAKPGRKWFPLLGLKIPHGFVPHWFYGLLGLALVLSDLLVA